VPAPPEVKIQKLGAEFFLPDKEMPRCELLVTGYPALPDVKINGEIAKPYRSNTGRINDFAGYARSGMPSKTARPWQMAAFDLRPLRGKNVTVQFGPNAEVETSAESWLLLDRSLSTLGEG